MITTIHQWFKTDEKSQKQLSDFGAASSRVMHKAFKTICQNNHENMVHYKVKIKNSPEQKIKKPFLVTSLSKEEKSQFALTYQMNGRHINSIDQEIKKRIEQIVESSKTQIKDSKIEVQYYEKKLKSIKLEINQILAQSVLADYVTSPQFKSYILSQQHRYLIYLIEKKSFEKSQKKDYPYTFLFYHDKSLHGKLCNSILLKNKDEFVKKYNLDQKTLKLTKKYAYLLSEVRSHERKIAKYNRNIKRLQSDLDHNKIHLCFGDRKILSKRHSVKDKKDFKNKNSDIFDHAAYHKHLQNPNEKYKTVEQWKKHWDNSRLSSFVMSGVYSEVCGNQNCTASYVGKLDEKTGETIDTFSLRLCLPEIVRGPDHKNRYLMLDDITFTSEQTQMFKAVLGNFAKSTVKQLSPAEKLEIKSLNADKKALNGEKIALLVGMKKQ